jgi:hypothetical protein
MPSSFLTSVDIHILVKSDYVDYFSLIYAVWSLDAFGKKFYDFLSSLVN